MSERTHPPVNRQRAPGEATPQEDITRGERSRSQSEVIGVVLLTAVVVVLMTLVGVVLIGNVTSDEREPRLAVEAEATSQNVTIRHAGGDTVDVGDVEVILRAAGEERYALESFVQLRGSSEGRFESGDKWYRSHGLAGDRMEVLVVHTPSNTILDRTAVTVEETLAARFETNVTNPTTLDTIEFDASGSVSQESEITSYEWDFGDGTTASGELSTHSYDDNGTYDVTLTVETSDGRSASRTRSVTVTNPTPIATFAVDPETPGVGESATFDASDSTTPEGTIVEYRWDFDDGTTETTTMETTTHSFSAFGTYDVTLTVTDDRDETATTTQTVTVSPPYFAVTITGTNSPVTRGDDVVVSATIENTGSSTDTQTIELENFEGSGVDSEQITLDRGESVTTDLRWQTGSTPAGTGTVTVTSANESATAQVTISESDIEILNGRPGSNANIVEFDVKNTRESEVTMTGITLNETSSAATEVNNGGQDELTFSGGGSLDVGGGNQGIEIGRTQYSLDADEVIASGDISTGTLAEFDSGMVGETVTITLYYKVDGEQKMRTETITVESKPYFDISVTGTNSPVEENGTVSVQYEVTNIGEATGTQTVGLAFDGNSDDSQQVQLDPGETGSGELTYSLDGFEGGPGEYSATVSTDNTSASTTVDVIEAGAPFLDIAITGTNEPVAAGETLTVTADITNTGDSAAQNADIALDIDGIGETDTTTVSIPAGETETVTLDWQTETGDGGDYTATISSTDSSDSVEVQVTEDADPQFEDISATVTQSAGGSGNIKQFAVSGDVLQPDTAGTIEFDLTSSASPATIDMTQTFDETFDGGNNKEIDITIRLLDEQGTVYQECVSQSSLTADNDLNFGDFSCG